MTRESLFQNKGEVEALAPPLSLSVLRETAVGRQGCKIPFSLPFLLEFLC